jgi:hypothetical protein
VAALLTPALQLWQQTEATLGALEAALPVLQQARADVAAHHGLPTHVIQEAQAGRLPSDPAALAAVAGRGAALLAALQPAAEGVQPLLAHASQVGRGSPPDAVHACIDVLS